MAIVTIKQLLETGVHFGHQTSDWDPDMDPYIFTSRNRIHIINLEKTVEKMSEAYNFVRNRVAEGEDVLFVCTKRQGSEIIKEQAERCGMFYVNYRWWGGMLTNFSTISKSVERLKDLERLEEEGQMEKLSKKEQSRLTKERYRLNRGLCGIKEMQRTPGVIFIVDIELEEIAVKEARKLNIPIVGLVDTNCSPKEIDYVVPGNDDALRSINLVTSAIADAALEGIELRKDSVSVEKELEKKEPGEEESREEKIPESEKEKEKSIKKEIKGEEEINERIGTDSKVEADDRIRDNGLQGGVEEK